MFSQGDSQYKIPTTQQLDSIQELANSNNIEWTITQKE